MKRQGIVLVIPKAGSGTAEHFAHTYALARTLSESVPTAVIIERLDGERPAAMPGVTVLVQNQADANPLKRLLELSRFCLRLRLRGFRTFFVRTSQTAAVALLPVTKLTGAHILYWHCGQTPRSKWSSTSLSDMLSSELPLRVALRTCHRFITGTRGLGQHYAQVHRVAARKIRVLPNEIDLAEYRPATSSVRGAARSQLDIDGEGPVVLAVHRLSPIRRSDLYFPTVPELVAAAVPGVRFLVVGDGPDLEPLRRRVAASPVGPQVRFVGRVAHADLHLYYHASDIFLMASYSEGFPRVLLEAMAFGLPFASTDAGGVPEIVPPAYRPLIAERADPAALASSAITLLQDPELRSQLVSDGLEWIEQFDAPVVARRLIDIAAGGD